MTFSQYPPVLASVVALPTLQTSWTPLSHCQRMSTVALGIYYYFASFLFPPFKLLFPLVNLTALSLVSQPPISPPPSPCVSITLKYKSHHVISIFGMLSCLIFSLAPWLSMSWPCSLLCLPPSSPPNAPGSHVPVSLHSMFSPNLPQTSLCWEMSLVPPHISEPLFMGPGICVPSPKLIPPLEHWSHCDRGL